MNRENRYLGVVLKFVIMGVVLLNAINIYILFLPVIDYYIYRANDDKYRLVYATVVERREKAIIYGKVRPLVDVAETRVVIEINQTIYYKSLYTYPEYEKSDNIMIAVSDNNICRCIPYEFTNSDMVDMTGYVIVTFACIVLYCILCGIEKVNPKLEKKEMSYSFSDSDMDDYINVESKKKRIIELMDMCHLTFKNVLVDKEEIEKQLGCTVNTHFLWCLEHFSGSTTEKLIFPFAVKNEEICYIAETKTFREQGLPDNYYVISYKDNILMCGCAYESRIFVFSRGIGVTNTKYFDVYDYIIENLERELNRCSMY